MQAFLVKITKIINDHLALLTTAGVFISTAVCIVYEEAYLSSFGLDYFSFGSLSDIFLIPLSNGLIASLSWLLILTGSLLLIPLVGIKESKNEFVYKAIPWRDIPALLKSRISQNFGSIALPLALPTLLFIVIVGTIFNLVDRPKYRAMLIKSGFSERYNVETDSSKQYSCHAILGGTSGYLFLWDYSNQHPRVISRSIIKSLEQVVPPNPPLVLLPRKWQSQSEVEAGRTALVQAQKDWSIVLKKQCSQDVDWKRQ